MRMRSIKSLSWHDFPWKLGLLRCMYFWKPTWEGTRNPAMRFFSFLAMGRMLWLKRLFQVLCCGECYVSVPTRLLLWNTQAYVGRTPVGCNRLLLLQRPR